jgi:hypothetical protein
MPPGFDPVWGTLGAPPAGLGDPWATARPDETQDGGLVSVEIFGCGFTISGQIRTGQFDRLSDWLNAQSGFVQVHEAVQKIQGQENAFDGERRKSPLWLRLDQIVLVAERTTGQVNRGGPMVVQKQRRKVQILTSAYSLRGSLHAHAHSTMRQFLDVPDLHFLPLTEVTVRWLEDPALAAHFPFAVVNRSQLITILEEQAGDSTGQPAGAEGNAAAEPMRRWGAA